jgi:hypothetical protein
MGCMLSPLCGCNRCRRRLREAHAPRSDCQRSDIIHWIMLSGIAYLVGNAWSSPKTGGADVTPHSTLGGATFAWRSGDEWACLLASHPSAQNAERMGHPDFMCDLEWRLEWVGHPTNEPAAIKLMRLPPLAKKPQGAGHPKTEFSSVKVRATRQGARRIMLPQSSSFPLGYGLIWNTTPQPSDPQFWSPCPEPPYCVAPKKTPA